MRIAEIFQSIQGEGEFAGTPSAFIRTTGCNLRCWFCDTPYTSWQPEGQHRSWQDVLQQVVDINCQHIVITGGEPMLQPDIVPLTETLRREGRFVTIETAGTIYRPVVADLMSISPKLSNSTPRTSAIWMERHDRDRSRNDIVQTLIASAKYQFKFVIDQPVDMQEVLEYLKDMPTIDRSRVWLMPQGVTHEELAARLEWLHPEANRLGFQVSPRTQIELYGLSRGT